MWLRRAVTGTVCLALGGCALPECGGGAPAAPKKIALRFYWATTDEKEGYRALQDEGGRPLRVAPDPFLTEDDIRTASTWRGSQRTMVLLELKGLAAARLDEASREHLGDRLAIVLDDRLVMSPVVRTPIAGGKVYLDGGFSPRQADDLAARLNARHATTQESRP